MKNSDTIKAGKLKERLSGKSEVTLNNEGYTELLARCSRLQTALEESEHQYYDLAESLPQTIFEIDLDGNIKYSNTHGLKTWVILSKKLKKG